jgi:hypothetical protein
LTINGPDLIINPGVDLIGRKRYALSISDLAVSNLTGDYFFTGLANYTSYTFRAGYTAGGAKTIAGTLPDVLAFDLTDNTCFIKRTNINPGLLYDGVFAGKFTVNGALDYKERGARISSVNNAHILTDQIPYNPAAGTLIVELSVQDFDTGQGTGSFWNGVIAFVRSSTVNVDADHYLMMNKADSGGRNSYIHAMWRTAAGTAVNNGVELNKPAGMPRAGEFGVIGMTWDANEIVLSNGESAFTKTVNSTYWTTRFPTDFKRLKIGPPSSSGIYSDTRRGIYRPEKLTAAGLDSAINSFLDFVGA